MRDGEPKRRYGVATYWALSGDEVDDAHLLARLGGYDGMTDLVRSVVDAELTRLRQLHESALAAARQARAQRESGE